MLIERTHDCIQLRVPWWIFFTIDKQAHSVQNNPGYDAMSSCNCTSNIVIINLDTVYDRSFMTSRCDVHIWTHCCLACLCDIKVVFIIILNVSSFKIHRVPLFYSISLRQTTINTQSSPIRGRDGATSCRVRCWSSGHLSVKTHTVLWGAQPELWRNL